MAQYIITNQPEPINFEIGDDFIARTVQNAKNLLMTHMGEVPYDRLRGFDQSLYHLPIDKMRMAEIMSNGEVLVTAIIEIEAED